MGEITAEEIIRPLRGELRSGPVTTTITGVSTDSRTILPGQLFIPLRGENFDGNDFILSAVTQGASAVVVEYGVHPRIPPNTTPVMIEVADTLTALGDLAGWWRAKHDIRIAAITGSTGKTTTKELTAAIIGLRQKTIKNEGNLNNLIGLPLTLLRIEEGDRTAVLEMGMNQYGEIGRLTEIADPNVGLITNVARAHLEGVGTIAGVARAKSELVERIGPSSTVILNGDDDLLLRTAKRFRDRVMTFGLGPGNDVRADNIQNRGLAGVSFDIRYRGVSSSIVMRSPGRHMIYNGLAAASIALCMDEPVEFIIAGLETYRGIHGRLMQISLGEGITLLDDTYNSNPSSLRAAIDMIKELVSESGRVIVGLGDMKELGEESLAAHGEAGGMVAELNNAFLIALGTYAEHMKTEAVENGLSTERAIVVHSHGEMVDRIAELMEQGDIILLKGSRRMTLEKVSEGLKAKITREDSYV